jgi:predicted N-acetyltransferase YhbS
MPTEPEIRPASEADLPEILALHARVFGPGRFVRTAYRVREGTPPLSPFCRIARMGGKLIAAVRFTPITIGGKGQALLLGPLAVDPDFAGLGYGRQLVGIGIEAARKAGIVIVILVGDEPYYARFGFKRLPPDQVILPGPVDPERVLAAALQPGAAGEYRGRVAAAA